jgi:hypothetical protein
MKKAETKKIFLARKALIYSHSRLCFYMKEIVPIQTIFNYHYLLSIILLFSILIVSFWSLRKKVASLSVVNQEIAAVN